MSDGNWRYGLTSHGMYRYCECCGHMDGECPRCGAMHVPAVDAGCEACHRDALVEREWHERGNEEEW